VIEPRPLHSTPLGPTVAWDPLLDARKAEYKHRIVAATSEELFTALAITNDLLTEQTRTRVEGKPYNYLRNHGGDLVLCVPACLDLYVFEGVLRINGVQVGQFERAEWRSVVPVRVIEPVVLGVSELRAFDEWTL
jgi:hypothetical protein